MVIGMEVNIYMMGHVTSDTNFLLFVDIIDCSRTFQLDPGN